MNEPAFPSQELDGSGSQRMALSPGMTLRDYFAAKALGKCLHELWGEADAAECAALAAYQIADAMLAERAKGTP